MNSKLLKRYCIIKVSVCIMLLFILSMTLHYLYESNAYMVQHNSRIVDEIQKLNFKIMNVHKHEAMLNDSGILWQEISTSNIYSTFYEENLGTLISNLFKKYYLFNFQINISSPKVVSDIYHKQHVDVIKRHIEIRFSSISDEQVFLFLNAIYHDISGYVKVIRVSIEKKTDITNEVLQAALKGETIPIVRGSIVFELYNIVGRFVNED
ncbi:hypothetical protein DB91_03975 [Ehrlichia sp. Wisconsin_h]|uniref:Uncharacterized protein n=2 Tax=Anaplasmataceae TaxID=942 RepID=A0A0F3N8W8_9RICK|nr:hypothetical protein EMUCRT_0828 [Ehrlichia cf. muris str. EmCRT]OUC04138.1 hypothetical protein DB91_03975 [Ehrlichia sp. Wisconsin_h]